MLQERGRREGVWGREPRLCSVDYKLNSPEGVRGPGPALGNSSSRVQGFVKHSVKERQAQRGSCRPHHTHCANGHSPVSHTEGGTGRRVS